MEPSSVYMCFPCYQEFPTLEEVLAHQLTCTAEAPAGTPAQVSQSNLQEEQPEEEQFIVSQDQATSSDPTTCAELAVEGAGLGCVADAPRILYQCGDCEVLFDSLSLWQQHRKQGECQQGGVTGGKDEAAADGSDDSPQQPTPEEKGKGQGGPCADTQVEATNETLLEAGQTETQPLEQRPCESAVGSAPTPAPTPTEPPIRRRGQKKAKPPSSLLCVECGAGFSAIAELVSHRRTQHGLQEALHRCQVCGEGFLNTTLFLYHRKQHPQPHPTQSSQQGALPLPLQQGVQVELLEEESHGQGLLLLAAAGEEQSLGLAPLAPSMSAHTQATNAVITGTMEFEDQTTPSNPHATPIEDMHVEDQTTPSNPHATPTEDMHAEDQTTSSDTVATPTETQGNPIGDQTTPPESQESQFEKGVGSQEEGEVSEKKRRREEEEGDEGVEAERRFLCRTCGSSFSSLGALQSHRQVQHGQQGALHTCQLCGQEFMSTTLFLYHRKEHRNTHTRQHTHTNTEDSGPTSCSDVAMELPEVSAAVPLISLALPAVAAAPSLDPVAAVSEPIPPPPAQLSRDWSRAALPHRCPHCGRSFTRRALLRAHVSSHTGQKLFGCALCPKAFSSPANLLRHSQTHAPPTDHSGAPRPYRCHVCAKDFSHATTLKRHVLTHTHVRPGRSRRAGPRSVRLPDAHGDGQDEAHGPYLHTCSDCPASFKMHTQLQKHRLLHTSHLFPCELCGEAFKRRKDLDLHSLSHQEPKTCPHCSAQFINQTVLQVHLPRCPGNPSEAAIEVEVGVVRGGRGRGQGRGKAGGHLECEMCGHRCVTQEGLELHRLSHTGQTPLRCPLPPCRRRFASGTALGEHVLAHCQGLQGRQRAPSRFRCQHCAKEFAYASTFAVHMRIHTDERPFECTHCGKRFRQLPHLQDHERIHSGLRPFACWVCGKSFSVAARLTEHARVHSGEKPYTCPRCPAAFRSRANLDKHLRFHADEPESARGEGETAVQTILLVHQAPSPPHRHDHDGHAVVADGNHHAQLEMPEGAGTLILPADHASEAGVLVPGSPSSSSVVILHPTITVPSAAGVPNISVVEGQEVPHTIEFIIEETI